MKSILTYDNQKYDAINVVGTKLFIFGNQLNSLVYEKRYWVHDNPSNITQNV